ncbi:MAG: hypothetical protein WB502_07245 [Thermoactinomyces sp.]
MAGNDRMTMSSEADGLIKKIITVLDLDINNSQSRPTVLKIAFAKGLKHVKDEPRDDFGGGGWVIPAGVIAKDTDYLLYKHLIINELQKPIDDKEVDQYLLRYIEEGLRVMNEEIDQLSPLENYMIKLTENI